MPNLPVRDLGKIGVIPDASPYSLPINAFSKATNVIFDEGRVQRAPVFKKLYEQMRVAQPYSGVTTTYNTIVGTYENTLGPPALTQRFITSYDIGSKEAVVVCDRDGQVREYPSGNLKMVTPTAGSIVNNDNPWTHAQVAGLSVLARKGALPYIRNLSTDGTYSVIAGQWDPTHTASIIRPFGDFLLAMNVQKGSTAYPTMVKWCHPLQFSQVPNSIRWDPSDTTSLAGENPIGEMRTAIRDGQALGNSFIIYSQDQVWTMELTESSKVFNFRKLFQTGGVLGPNCIVEVDGIHYCFGEDDLYKHDGVTRKSIGDTRVRQQVYANMNRDKKDTFFTHHDTVLNLIYFCYASRETDLGFPGTAYCNKAAVYNYREDTWSFLDLPNCVGAADTKLSLYQAGYGTDSLAVTPKVSVMLGIYDPLNGLTESRVYAVDNPNVGIVYLSPHYETIKPVLLERTGIDLDTEAGFQLRTYKQIQAIMPQVVFKSATGQLKFQIGASDQIDGPVNWQEPIAFDHLLDYKVDTRAAGRYLAIRVTSDTSDYFRFPSYDIEVQKMARR